MGCTCKLVAQVTRVCGSRRYTFTFILVAASGGGGKDGTVGDNTSWTKIVTKIMATDCDDCAQTYSH